jgi:signal transduction histidine kinase
VIVSLLGRRHGSYRDDMISSVCHRPRLLARRLRRLWRRESQRANPERLRWAVRVRGTVIVLFLAVAVVAFASGVLPSLLPTLVAGTAGAAMNLMAARRVARWERIPGMLIWTGIGDAALISYVVAVTGGTASPFLLLYVMQVLTAALLVDVVLGACVGGISVLMLTGAVVAGDPGTAGSAVGAWVAPDRMVWLLSLGVTLVVLVFVGGHLTRRLARSERRLAGTHRRLTRSLSRLTDAHAELQDAYERLRRAETQLITTDRMRTLQVLVAGLAHELGNPLTVLAGNVAPLEDVVASYERMVAACAVCVDGAAGPDADAARHALADGSEIRREAGSLLANCGEATRRAVALLGQLRDFGRGGRGTVRRLAPLAPGLTSTLALVRHRLPSRVTVHESYADVPDVLCVPAELNQVFINLLMNAIDALKAGGNLWLTLDAAENAVSVTVRDDGAGIVPDLLPRIFEPFVTSKDAGHGTGLGLAISQTIVARHRGSIEAANAPGGGAVFTVRLPIPSAISTPEIGRGADGQAVA